MPKNELNQRGKRFESSQEATWLGFPRGQSKKNGFPVLIVVVVVVVLIVVVVVQIARREIRKDRNETRGVSL